MIALVVVSVLLGGLVGMGIGTNYEDPDLECEKWIKVVELTKQDFPHYVKHILPIAEEKCGFELGEIITQENNTSKLK